MLTFPLSGQKNCLNPCKSSIFNAIALGVQAFVKLTEDAKETMDSAVQGAIRKAVDAKIKEPINKYR